MRHRTKPPAQLARKVLGGSGVKLEFLRERVFHLDEDAAHDDDLHERLCEEYSAEFDRLKAELSKTYGKPLRAGSTNTRLVPLNGVFRYAVWKVRKRHLFIAAAREDRECPMWLVLGATSGGTA